jgi:2,6-dihydroxypseudooxynicotine hydrolase
MTQDARVKSALAHWAPRFVANGVALTDFEEVVGAIPRWDDWCRAWSDRAVVHEAMGREALAAGKLLSAGEHLQRAGVYYHFGKFLFVHNLDQMKAAHAKAVECRRLALPHLNPPGERVAIPFESGHLYGILRKPAGAVRPPGRPPVMIMCCGLDSAKEETDAYEAPFLARGIAILVFDGPGQGEAEYDWPIRGNYETAVAAVCDYVETRADLDTARIGLWGVSLGGYYAPRAAAFEPRLEAVAGISGPFNFGAIWDHLPPLTRETFVRKSHASDDEDGRRRAGALSLDGVVEQLDKPALFVTGKLDRLIPWEETRRAAAAAPQGEFVLFEDGNHVCANVPYKARPLVADWLREQLA